MIDILTPEGAAEFVALCNELVKLRNYKQLKNQLDLAQKITNDNFDSELALCTHYLNDAKRDYSVNIKRQIELACAGNIAAIRYLMASKNLVYLHWVDISNPISTVDKMQCLGVLGAAIEALKNGELSPVTNLFTRDENLPALYEKATVCFTSQQRLCESIKESNTQDNALMCSQLERCADFAMLQFPIKPLEISAVYQQGTFTLRYTFKSQDDEHSKIELKLTKSNVMSALHKNTLASVLMKSTTRAIVAVQDDDMGKALYYAKQLGMPSAMLSPLHVLKDKISANRTMNCVGDFIEGISQADQYHAQENFNVCKLLDWLYFHNPVAFPDDLLAQQSQQLQSIKKGFTETFERQIKNKNQNLVHSTIKKYLLNNQESGYSPVHVLLTQVEVAFTFDDEFGEKLQSSIVCPVTLMFHSLVRHKQFELARYIHDHSSLTDNIRFIIRHESVPNHGIQALASASLHEALAGRSDKEEIINFYISIEKNDDVKAVLRSMLSPGTPDQIVRNNAQNLGVSIIETSPTQLSNQSFIDDLFANLSNDGFMLYQDDSLKPKPPNDIKKRKKQITKQLTPPVQQKEAPASTPRERIISCITDATCKLGLCIKDQSNSNNIVLVITHNKTDSHKAKLIKQLDTEIKKSWFPNKTHRSSTTMMRKSVRGQGETLTITVPNSDCRSRAKLANDKVFENAIFKICNQQPTQDNISFHSRTVYTYQLDDAEQIHKQIQKIAFNVDVERSISLGGAWIYRATLDYRPYLTNDNDNKEAYYQLQDKNKLIHLSECHVEELAQRLGKFGLVVKFDNTAHQLSIELPLKTQSEKVISNPDTWRSTMSTWFNKLERSPLIDEEKAPIAEEQVDELEPAAVSFEKESIDKLAIEALVNKLIPDWSDNFLNCFDSTKAEISRQLYRLPLKQINAVVSVDDNQVKILDFIQQVLVKQIPGIRYMADSQTLSIHQGKLRNFINTSTNQLLHLKLETTDWVNQQNHTSTQTAKLMITPAVQSKPEVSTLYFTELLKRYQAILPQSQEYAHYQHCMTQLASLCETIQSAATAFELNYLHKAFALYFDRLISILIEPTKQGHGQSSDFTDKLSTISNNIRTITTQHPMLESIFKDGQLITRMDANKKTRANQKLRFNLLLESVHNSTHSSNHDLIEAEWAFIKTVLSKHEQPLPFHLAAIAHSCEVIYELTREANGFKQLNNLTDNNKDRILQTSKLAGNSLHEHPAELETKLENVIMNINF